MTTLVRYDAMCTAIAECHRIDEVKDLRDKAMALELYARQARNTDAERKASEVRLRAERRTGELLKELARADESKGGDLRSASKRATPIGQSPYARALADTGMSRQTAHRYEALANVPAPAFEAALRDPAAKPTTTRLLQQAMATPPQMPDDVLWLWGRMRDFERDGFATKDATSLLNAMTDSMRTDVARIAPLMAEFVTRMEEVSNEFA